ncbi:MAG TPA: ATP-binding protein [Cyclobacteriaceae bacterium]|jgi:signal transduction histidine kinase|nr:ATP-binding protein [Cyclobacteriaceae bacterium]
MKVGNKLTLTFASLFTALLLCFAFAIYFSASVAREREYYDRLRQDAITRINLLLDAKVKPEVLQLIYAHSPNPMYKEEVAIFDKQRSLLYHDAVGNDKIKETPELFNKIVGNNVVTFSNGDVQMVGFTFKKDGEDYIVTVAAIDESGLRKLQTLKYTIAIGLAAGIFFTIVFGRIFSTKALRPVAQMVNEAEKITATNLDQRIPVANDRDEIGELASTFNRMLDRLEDSFDAQKQFVSNVAHEIRTPLSAIIVELELAISRARNLNEYELIIRRTLNDARKLSKLSTDLLDLAKASYSESEINFKIVRVDEILLDAWSDAQKLDKRYTIDIQYEDEIENAGQMSTTGNEYLLKIAFTNLIENACKYSSDHHCLVSMASDEREITLRFIDHGPGISETELSDVFTLFYRGANARSIHGHGIGLFLASRITKLHFGKIYVTSERNLGSVFTVTLMKR